MISKSQIKLITSLQQKKFRSKLKLFVAEGPKLINELLAANYNVHSIYVTVEGLYKDVNPIIISKKEISKISFLKNLAGSLEDTESGRFKILLQPQFCFKFQQKSVKNPQNLRSKSSKISPKK